MFPTAPLAADDADAARPTKPAGEDRWVPSLAIISGVTFQQQQGIADSCLFPGDTSPGSCSTTATPPDPGLRGFVDGDDIATSPFVGGTLELMTPALSIPTRPRLFASGEILPTFASDRDLALEGDPGCVRGSQPDAPCASDGGARFAEDQANGQGTSTIARIDTLAYSASLGVAFPFQFGKRQLRIKPSVGWINYKVEANGFVVNAACGANPNPPPATECTEGAGGFLRDTTLVASGSQRFNGIGPGLEIEMDTGQYGPLGVSLFMGGRAYAVVGDRTISFDTEESFDDQIGMDVARAQFEVEVDPWVFRAHLGIRFHWLGNRE